MVTILEKDKIVLNVDTEEERIRYLSEGWRELTTTEIETAGMVGYEHLVSPANTVVNGDGTISFIPPRKPTLEEQVQAAYKALDANVEKRLNDFAATRRYSSIYTACNARDSHITKYAIEGAYCFKMWGETYAKCEELLNEYMPAVLAGERPIPTWEEIEEQLPPLVWPNEE